MADWRNDGASGANGANGRDSRPWLSPFASDAAEAIESEYEWPGGELATEEESPTPRQVRARILWPALGFPAVIAPRARPAESWMLDANATRCVCVLMLSNRRLLSAEDVAAGLRYVAWPRRGRRHIASGQPGSFAATELAVRNDAAGGPQQLALPNASDDHAQIVSFGGDREGEHGITVTLAQRVRKFYQSPQLQGDALPYLHEVRVSEAASGRLADGQYHLFWNNAAAREDAPSDEMALLLRHFAPRRREGLGALWRDQRAYLLEEYEYEYGNAHRPYATTNARAGAGPRAEVLHPLFVKRDLPASLKIGHLTDLHVDVRADVYEENLRRANVAAKYRQWQPWSYNNWNQNFVKVYAESRQRSHVLLLTGDLVDYGRGHWGPAKPDTLGQDGMYHVDRNWFLFYYLLASGNAYDRPAYTILGNHDWRLNPYPPFAIAGTPAPKVFLHNHAAFSESEQAAILRLAHGAGHDAPVSYDLKAKGILSLLKLGVKSFVRMIAGRQTIDERGTPVETTVESVAWYLLAINPFLDYAFTLPPGQRVLMLDWAEDEDVLFPIIDQGGEYPYIAYALHKRDRDKWSDPGPKAKRCLTDIQKRLLADFTGTPGAAKVIGIHAPPVGPYSDWTDADLLRSRKTYRSKAESRGPMDYATKRPDGTIERWNGHPLFALRPRDAGLGVEADYGSFERARETFFKQVTDDRSRVRLVFAGHIHRASLLVVNVPTTGGKAIAGNMRIHGLTEALVRGARPPAVSPAPQGAHGPLFVNGTSLGPLGHFYPTDGPDVTAAPGYAIAELASDGTIRGVEFRPPMPRVLPVAAPVPAMHRETAGVPVG